MAEFIHRGVVIAKEVRLMASDCLLMTSDGLWWPLIASDCL